MLTMVSLLLVGGSLGDQFGRRRMFVIGLIAFGATSVLCAVAPSVEFLVGARALQGIAGALLVPGSLAIVAATFEGAARGKAVGTWTAWTGIATVIGPAGGGALIERLSWRAIFWVNLPLIAVTVALTLRAVEESRDPGRLPRHRLGRDRALGGRARRPRLRPDRAADPRLGRPAGLGAAGRRHRLLRPLRPPRGARPPPDARPRPLPHPQLLGRQPDHADRLRRADRRALLRRPLPPAGRRLLGAGGGPGDDADLAPALRPLAALRPARLGHRAAPADDAPARSSAASGCCCCCGSAPDADYVADVLPAILVFGLGLSATVAPLTATVLDSVEERHVGIASGVNNGVSRVAGLLAIAVLGAVISAKLRRQRSTPSVGERPAEPPRELADAKAHRLDRLPPRRPLDRRHPDDRRRHRLRPLDPEPRAPRSRQCPARGSAAAGECGHGPDADRTPPEQAPAAGAGLSDRGRGAPRTGGYSKCRPN